MPNFLTFLSEFVVLAFGLIVVTDFVTGLAHLWKSVHKEPQLPAPAPVQLPVIEDPWLSVDVSSSGTLVVTPLREIAQREKVVCTDRESHTTEFAPRPLLLPPAKSKSISLPKSVIKKAEAPDTIPAGLAEMTAVHLRKLCATRNIKWRNAHGGGKHLSKTEMIRALTV